MGIVQEASELGSHRRSVIRLDFTRELLEIPSAFVERIRVTPSTLLANDLLLHWDMGDPSRRLDAFLQDRALAGRVMEQLLLYDRVVVPTVDFSIIVPLIHWLGADVVVEMLVTEALSFVRFRGGLSYVGNGVGLSQYEILPSDENPSDPFWMEAARADAPKAVELQLRNRLNGLEPNAVSKLCELVAICTVDTALPEFSEKVANETYRDILGSKVLHTYFSLRNKNVKQLAGLEANQMRFYTAFPKSAVTGDEIDTTLRLAMLNLEAYLCEEAGARDMVTDRGFGKLLDAKVDRGTGGVQGMDAYFKLADVVELPDLTVGIGEGTVAIRQAWEFRNSDPAGIFRRWFDDVGPQEPNELVRAYLRAMEGGGLWDHSHTKVLRYLVTNTAAAAMALALPELAPVTALGIGAADSFLLEKIGAGYKPRYFFDEYRRSFFP